MRYKEQMSHLSCWLWGFFMFWIEAFLAVRFILHFFAVDPTNGFATWIFNSTDTMMTPFRGVFTLSVAGNPHYVDFQTLFVMAAYGFFCAFMMWLLRWPNKAKK